MTQKMERVIEKLGEAVYTEQDIISEFGGKTQDEILSILNDTYSTDDNAKLAEMITEVT